MSITLEIVLDKKKLPKTRLFIAGTVSQIQLDIQYHNYFLCEFHTSHIHLERVMKNMLLHSSLLHETINCTQSCTTLIYALQNNFEYSSCKFKTFILNSP